VLAQEKEIMAVEQFLPGLVLPHTPAQPSPESVAAHSCVVMEIYVKK
jgi:hypothetical protein